MTLDAMYLDGVDLCNKSLFIIDYLKFVAWICVFGIPVNTEKYQLDRLKIRKLANSHTALLPLHFYRHYFERACIFLRNSGTEMRTDK